MRNRRRAGMYGLLVAFFTCMVLPAVAYAGLPADARDYVGGRLEKPSLCLAVSGGGLRSAAFSTGVLRQLHLSGFYKSLDLVAGASGGSWAMLWVNSAAAARDLSLDELFGKTAEDRTQYI